MPRKAPSTPLTVLQADADPDHPGIGSQLAVLDRLDARQREQDTGEIEQLRESWGPQLRQAKSILAELSGLQAAYGPTLEAFATRDFSRLPPTASTLNAVAAIERSCLDLQHHLTHTPQDLQRIVTAIEGLSPRTVALLHANSATYRELLGFYKHSPQGVRELFHRLEHTVATLTSGVESEPTREPSTPAVRLPAPQMLAPEVEMA
jgi:hypothetical protein